MSDDVHHVNRQLVDKWRSQMFMSFEGQDVSMAPQDFLVLMAEIPCYGIAYLESIGYGTKAILFQYLIEMMGALMEIEGFENSETVTVGLVSEITDPFLSAVEEIARSKWNAEPGN